MRKKFSLALQASVRNALRYLNDVNDLPVGPRATLEELRSRICKPLNIEEIPAQIVVEELVNDVEGGLTIPSVHASMAG